MVIEITCLFDNGASVHNVGGWNHADESLWSGRHEFLELEEISDPSACAARRSIRERTSYRRILGLAVPRHHPSDNVVRRHAVRVDEQTVRSLSRSYRDVSSSPGKCTTLRTNQPYTGKFVANDVGSAVRGAVNDDNIEGNRSSLADECG